MANSSVSDSSSDDALEVLNWHEQTPLLGRDPGAQPRKLSGIPSSLDESNHNAWQDPESQAGSVVSKRDEETASKTSVDLASVISVLLLGAFVANADASIVMATYGTISSELGSLEDASWVVVTYSLSMCAVQSMYGKLSDIYGRKAMLITAYTLFTLGCAMCGLGQTLWQVILGRGISGLGGAGMISLVSILIADTVPLRDVAAWRSYVNVASTVGRSTGGPLGGFLADTVGWRWSFLFQCPLTLIAIALVFWKLKGPDKSTDDSRKLHRVDFLGSLTLAVAITTFLLAVDMGGHKLPWTHPIIWILFGSSLLSGLLFLVIEAYVAPEPILPLRLLIHRDVMTTNLLAILQSSAQFAVMFTVPLYFQVTAQTSITVAGFHLIPAVFGNAIGSLLVGFLIKRTVSYKLLTIIGTMVASVGYLLLILRWHGDTNIWESLYIMPGGFGTGVMYTTVFISLAAGVDESQMAIATSSFYLSANMGTLLGASLSSTVLQKHLRTELGRALQGFPGRNQITRRALSDLGYVKSLKGSVKDIVVASYVKSFEHTHTISLVCSVLAFFVALSMKEHSLE